jgi:phenylalanine-4-hydroxylase
MDDDVKLYAPMVVDDAGYPRFRFPREHPAYGDTDYTVRRDRIAYLGMRHERGAPAPHIDYHDDDDDTWRRISAALAQRHRQYAAAEMIDGAAVLDLPVDRVPQLDEVSEKLDKLTGFRLVPAVGFVPIDEFYGSLNTGEFFAAQFIRHHSQPLFSPEADVVHELLGHGPALATPALGDLYRAVGEAVHRTTQPRTVQLISRMFWFTLEYGVLATPAGEFKAYGAGLLSSCGEIEQFQTARIRPLDLADMAAQDYDITVYQPNLFAARSLTHVQDFLGEFLSSVDDETPARLNAPF